MTKSSPTSAAGSIRWIASRCSREQVAAHLMGGGGGALSLDPFAGGGGSGIFAASSFVGTGVLLSHDAPALQRIAAIRPQAHNRIGFIKGRLPGAKWNHLPSRIV